MDVKSLESLEEKNLKIDGDSPCKGCRTYIVRIKLFPHGTHECCGLDNIHKCPCLQCIVKSMCNQECELYEYFKNGYYNLYSRGAKL